MIVIKVVIKLESTRMRLSIPSHVVIVYRHARIEIGEIKGGRIDYPFTTLTVGQQVMPRDVEFYRIVGHQWPGQIHQLIRGRIRMVIPGDINPPCLEIVDFYTGQCVPGTPGPGAVNILDQLHIQTPQRIRAIVEIGDLLDAPDRIVRRRYRYRDTVTSMILPVFITRFAIERARSIVKSSLYLWRHSERLCDDV